MTDPLIILAFGLGLAVVGIVGALGLPRWRRRGGGRAVLGLMKAATTPLVRLYWGARYVGFERMPTEAPPEGLILVSNHTSGLDPVLIEHPTDFDVRWLMMKAMMVPGVRRFARWKGLIAIEFGPGDRAAMREAISIVKSGGVIGIFPEGGIARPARHIRPFMKGVGLLVARTGARVALINVSGVPERRNAFTPLLLPCRARIELIDVIDYAGERDVSGIADDLRERMREATGWPLDDAPLTGNS